MRARGNRGLEICTAVAAVAGVAPQAQEPGTVQHEEKIAWSSGGFAGDLGDFDEFGQSLCALGDLDGDGVEDLAVGAPGDDDGDPAAGAVWVLFMNPDGTVKSESKISQASGGFLGDLGGLDRFGTSVAALGDLDGDGLRELAVGAELDDDGGFDRGAVWILFLDASGLVRAESLVSQTSGGFGSALRDRDRFGHALALLEDLDGNGVEDLAVGAPQDDDGGFNRGAVWILYLDAQGGVLREEKISATAGGFGGALANGSLFGSSLASLGDLDGNGTFELAVGAEGDPDGGPLTGALWIVSFDTEAAVASWSKLGLASGLPLHPTDFFGTSCAVLPDLDGNGVTELAVGATGDDDGGTAFGATWVLFLEADGSASAYQKISALEGGFDGTLVSSGGFGRGLGTALDMNGDARPELLVGAGLDDEGGTDRGAAWVLFLDGVETGSTGTLVTRTGTGNADVLTAQEAPRIGVTWAAEVDCSAWKRGVVLHLGVSEPLEGRVHRQFGEWLIDRKSERIFMSTARHRGNTVTLRYDVPDDPALVGLLFYSQALVTGRPGPRLTNALDGTVGE